MKRRGRLLILVVAVVIAVGVALALYLRHLEFLNAFACGDSGGSWMQGHCEGP